jgi:hypothetical protein
MSSKPAVGILIGMAFILERNPSMAPGHWPVLWYFFCRVLGSISSEVKTLPDYKKESVHLLIR